MQIKAQLTGTMPLLMHNEQLADPMNAYTKAIKVINDKGSKKMTDDDLAERSRLEWEGGLYYDPTLGPYVPAHNVVKAMYVAGTTRRMGTMVERAVTSLDARLPLLYNGPRGVNDMYKAGYVDRRMVGVNRNRVHRTRPRYTDWSLACEYFVDTEILNADDFRSILTLAGRAVGICDARRIGYGRFTVEFTEVENG